MYQTCKFLICFSYLLVTLNVIALNSISFNVKSYLYLCLSLNEIWLSTHRYAKYVFPKQEMFKAQKAMESIDISFVHFECQKPSFAPFKTTFDIGELKCRSQNQTFLFKNQSGN